jgi:TatD DNase family protein
VLSASSTDLLEFGGSLRVETKVPDLIDTHCHLDFEAFNDDRKEVLSRAFESGVERVLNPGIDLESSRAAVTLADTYPQIFASVGIHPNYAQGWDEQALDELRDLASHPKVVAIGEIGLDYYRDYAPHDLQRSIFRRQLELAAELDLPVVIHNRQATTDVLSILTAWHAEFIGSHSPLQTRPGVLHSFSETGSAAQKALSMDFFMGITGPVTFNNAEELRQTVAQLPLDHLLIETDAPFLTPQPKRGKRNEPAFVRFVAEKISGIHNLPFETVAARTSANADRLFNWRETD